MVLQLGSPFLPSLCIMGYFGQVEDNDAELLQGGQKASGNPGNPSNSSGAPFTGGRKK